MKEEAARDEMVKEGTPTEGANYGAKERATSEVAREDMQTEEKIEEEERVEEVDGVFEPCMVSREEGQLHRMLMEKAGHPLTQSVTRMVHTLD